jgi:hypothetical protein
VSHDAAEDDQPENDDAGDDAEALKPGHRGRLRADGSVMSVSWPRSERAHARPAATAICDATLNVQPRSQPTLSQGGMEAVSHQQSAFSSGLRILTELITD